MLLVKKRRLRRKLKFKVKLCLVLLLTIIVVVFLDAQLRPVIQSMAQYRAKNMATQIMNQAVYEVLDQKSDLFDNILTIQKNQEGNITAVEANTSAINRIQSDLSDSIVNSFMNMVGQENNEIDIPLGTLLGIQLFSGRGPEIQMKIVPNGAVKTVTESKFISSGINQTLHQIVVNVEATVTAIIPGYTTSVVVPANYILAETLIVGSVPNAYAQILSQNEQAIPNQNSSLTTS